MNYRFLDMESYKRKSHFEYFRNFAYPYVGVTVDVEITGLVARIKEKKQSFFLSFCYCAAGAANAVPEFRQRIIDGRIAEFEHCRTSHTVGLEDGTYCYCTLDCGQSFETYLPYAAGEQQKAKEAGRTEDEEGDVNELFFISTMPWLSYTSLVQPAPMPADSNPRITWAGYHEQDGKIMIPVSVLCNHALVDGIHISQFYKELDRQISRLSVTA